MMNKLIQRLFVLFLMCVNFMVYANEVSKGISVSGHASMSVQPDRFTLHLSIEERGKVASKLKRLVDSKTEQLIAVAKKFGIKETDIQSGQLHMQPIYRKQSIRVHRVEAQLDMDYVADVHPQSKDKEQYQPVAVLVGRSIQINLNSFSFYDKLLDKLLKIGIDRVSRLEYKLSNEQAIYQKMLLSAIANAKSKAEVMAVAANVKLGSIVMLNEESYGANRLSGAMSMYSANRDSSVSLPGKLEVSARVRIVFAIVGKP